jgi:hypothetical protein
VCNNCGSIGNGGSSSGGAVTLPDYPIVFYAGNWDYTTNSPSVFEYDTGTNGKKGHHALDDTTEEFLGESTFWVPKSLKESGSVKFLLNGFSKIAVASRNIQYKIYLSVVDTGESWDQPYASFTTGDLAVSGTQDVIDKFEIIKTVAELGLAKGQENRIKISRIVAGVNNLVDDYFPTFAGMLLPQE